MEEIGVVSTHTIRRRGLLYLKIGHEEQHFKGLRRCIILFKSLYGSYPRVLANQWQDLCHTSKFDLCSK